MNKRKHVLLHIRLLSSAAQEVRFSPALWRVVSRRRRSPPTTALLLLQQGPLTLPFGQVSRALDKSVLSVSVQREVPLRPPGSLSQELCHHSSTRTQGPAACLSTANPRLPRTPAVAHDTRWWPKESRRRPHLHLREHKTNGEAQTSKQNPERLGIDPKERVCWHCRETHACQRAAV